MHEGSRAFCAAATSYAFFCCALKCATIGSEHRSNHSRVSGGKQMLKPLIYAAIAIGFVIQTANVPPVNAETKAASHVVAINQR